MQQQVSDTPARGRDPDVIELLNGTDVADESVEGDTLSDDDVFEVLYNRRRRDVISYLLEEDGSSTVGELAEYIAAKENDSTVQQLSSSERKRVYVGLYQNHLPMMDDVGVVDYDKNRGTVKLRECVTQLEPYLNDTVESDVGIGRVVGTFALAGVILLGILDVSVLALAPNLLWVGLGVAGCFGLAALAAYDDLNYRSRTTTNSARSRR